ncbi:MAG: hypothetical protein M0031_14690 [Thermaerobacter sp.]|nr:hypothetical protein [Thermaerobacter sp.]
MRLSVGPRGRTLTMQGQVCSLLSFLLLHRDGSRTRARLAEVLWPDSGREQARVNLRKTIHRLGRELPEACACLELEGPGLGVREGAAVGLDVDRFRAAGREGSVHSLERAVKLYRGGASAGVRGRVAGALAGRAGAGMRGGSGAPGGSFGGPPGLAGIPGARPGPFAARSFGRGPPSAADAPVWPSAARWVRRARPTRSAPRSWSAN